MFGLAVLLAFGLYLALCVAVVRFVARWAKKHERKPWVWGGLAAFLMYNLVFWDWVPTIIAHKYYCSTQAGFWVYKTLDQWKAENPGVMEMLVVNKGYPSSHDGDMANYTTTNFLNSRFNLVVRHRGPLFLHRWLREDILVDKKTNEILARYVDFSTSQQRRQAGWSGWKFWLDSRQCVGGLDKAIESGKFMNQFRGMEE